MLPQARSEASPLELRGTSFLSLAPTTSASYPPTPKSPTQAPEPAAPVQQSAQADASTVAETNAPAAPPADEVTEHLKIRRSSSSGSDASSKRGYLKLGPVHFGEGNGDWSEDVLA
jgi:hypothetical protein